MKVLISCKTVSVRLPHKNFADLGGKPLWRWSYDWAVEEGLEPVVLFRGPGALDMPADVPVRRHPTLTSFQEALCMMGEGLSDSEQVLLAQVTNPFRRRGLARLLVEDRAEKAVITKTVKTLDGPRQYETGLLYKFPMAMVRGAPIKWSTIWQDARAVPVNLSYRELVNIDTLHDLMTARQLVGID